MGDFKNPVKVSINQFYGIEINDFAVTVAKTALWIAESQMVAETEKIIQHDIDFLPLKSYANIKEGNALRLSWYEWEMEDKTPTIYAKRTIVYPNIEEKPGLIASEPQVYYETLKLHTDKIETSFVPEKPETHHVNFDYIMGNPPFVGYSFQSKEQKEDLAVLMDGFGKNIDYVAGWYVKASQLIHGTNTHCALVSTNSITQGEQVAAIWKPLFEQYDIHIDFAYRTFRWDSEADIKAHVHCVVLGFSAAPSVGPKTIYLSETQSIQAKNINGYLLDAPNLFIEKRTQPLCDVPEMIKGSIPVDDGNLIIEKEDYDEFIHKEPKSVKYIKRFLGAREFLHNEKRYCLWLKEASPSDLNTMPLVKERIAKTKAFRLKSSKEATRKYADYPSVFMEVRQPANNYIIVPSHSSENRRYIPIGFENPDVICGNANLMIPNATLYHLGILTSNVHNAWMRVVCGRLEMRYRYSNTIVYNNFPWPNPTEAQKAKIEQTAQAILDARAKYPDSSLADLYDELTMPLELRSAHQENDKAVMAAYGFKSNLEESEIVAELFRLYEGMVI